MACTIFCWISVDSTGDPVWVRIQPVIQSKIMAGRRTNVAILRKTGVLCAFTLCSISSSPINSRLQLIIKYYGLILQTCVPEVNPFSFEKIIHFSLLNPCTVKRAKNTTAYATYLPVILLTNEVQQLEIPSVQAYLTAFSVYLNI